MSRFLWISLLFGCVEPSNGTDVEVTGTNDLGVATLHSERRAEDGLDVRRLVANDAAGIEIARIEERVGSIAEVARRFPGPDSRGSEQIITIGDQTWHSYSRETNVFTIANVSGVPAFESLFRLPPVRSALAEMNVFAAISEPHAARDTAFSYGGCSASSLNTSPTVSQCCQDSVYLGYDNQWASTWFVPTSGANAGAVVVRYQSPYGPCRAFNGGSCSGADCYYGPNGFARASVHADSYNIIVSTYLSYYNPQQDEWYYDTSCNRTYTGTTEFPGTMTGTFATGQGCPGGDSGEYSWDY